MSDAKQQAKASGTQEPKRNTGERPAVGRGPMAMMKGENARDFRGTMKRLVSYFGKYRWLILLGLVLATVGTIFGIIGPRLQGYAIDELSGIIGARMGGGEADFSGLISWIIRLLLIYGGFALASYIVGLIMTGVSADIAYRFRQDISAKMHRLPLKYYDGTTHGEVLSRITNDVDVINQTLSQGISQMITSLVTVVGSMVMMFSIDWRLTLAALVIIPLSMVVVSAIIKRSQKYFKDQQANLGHVNGHIEEMFSGHLVVKAFNGEHRAIEKFDVHNDDLHEAAWKSQFLSGLMMPIMLVFGNISFVVVAVMGGWFVAAGTLTIGAIASFIQYVRQFNQPLMQIANISNVLQQTAAAAERVFEFLEEGEEIAETSSPVALGKVSGHVEFRNVHFGYDPSQPVIKDFSAEASPGQKIAIVGPTGAGKTTMVKLLMRFYDIDSGQILIDGNEIRDFARSGLRGNFAMVLQDSWLYNATVMENIRYGRPEASDEEVMEAAKAAHVDHFIHTWPDGYNMMINEETSNISQGQKQLLTIARAILADPRMLILDEATSSVDTRTEVLTQKAMDRLMHGRTSFIIAHRLSTIRNADLILVMNEGDIIEQGTHDQLMADDGFYADLYNSQFEHVEAVG
jgi:ATP-binding cassette subfamily B multidrug efflux pump